MDIFRMDQRIIVRQIPQHTDRNFRPLSVHHSILPIPSKVEFVTERESAFVYPAVIVPLTLVDDEDNVFVVYLVRLELLSGLVAEDEITGLNVVKKNIGFMKLFLDILYDIIHCNRSLQSLLIRILLLRQARS